jgi:hypothetical protein
MIISHKHKFIFIKTRKTAGSSIEHYLSKYLGPDDICTGSDIDNTPRLNAPHRKGHIDYRWVAKKFPYEWRNYYKFAIDRNPWTKMISYFHWHRRAKGSFEDFCLEDTKQYDCWFRYADDIVQVDRVMRYEDLHNEVTLSPLPYADELLTTFKKQDPDKVMVLHTPKTILAIEHAFADVIDYFGYEYT